MLKVYNFETSVFPPPQEVWRFAVPGMTVGAFLGSKEQSSLCGILSYSLIEKTILLFKIISEEKMQVTINLNIDDRYINFFRKVFTKRKAVLALLVAALATNLNADTITKLYTFRGGDTIIASQVNDNFDQLFTKVNELDGFGHWSASSGDISYNGGNVGIGTGSPLSLLHVNSTNEAVMKVNRNGNDGTLISLEQDGSQVGTISVGGGTISYNTFMGSHWSELSDKSKPDIPRGTVVSTIDEVISGHGDRLAKFKISDVEADTRVYGVFMDWDKETGYAYINALGATLIRVTGKIKGGDLLISAGDGTAKAQADDIIRSSTIGKVTVGDNLTEDRLVAVVLYSG